MINDKHKQKDNFIFEVNDLSLDNDELMLNETLFHNANGYIGVRSNFEEGYKPSYRSIRGQYINGFYDIAEMKQAEKLYGFVEEKQTMLNVVDTQGIKLFIDGEEFSMFSGEIIKSSRTLDMKKGYTQRKILWRSPKNHEIELVIKRMTSFEILPLFLIDYEIKSVNFEGEVKIVSSHIGDVMNYCDPSDPRVAGESFKHLLPNKVLSIDGTSLITARTSVSDLEVASCVSHVISKEHKQTDENLIDSSTATKKITFHLSKGETVSLQKYTILCDSIRYQNCEESALEIMKKALSTSLDALYQAQEDYLTQYWDSCMVNVHGDDELSIAVYYNLYQLVQSVSKDKYSNIAAKGLSGEGYEGHYFWDTEMYIQPFFTLTQPEISKNLIRYRYNILNEARENARILGHKKGAAYAWRTIMGKECSGYYPSGSAQYHISGDIAYSIISYYLVTKDIDFIAECGAEVIFEIARMWMDIGNYVNDQFMINEVTGPDEYTCLVNNNYYTNVLAQYNLKWAVKFYDLLEKQGKLNVVAKKINLSKNEIDEFLEASNKMYLPYDEKLDINPQDDSFLQKKVWDIKNTPKDKFPLLLHYHPMVLYRHQVCKQADTVLAHFIFEDAQKLSTIKNSFEYYEKVTTHDSSLSTCIFSIVASKLGLHDKAFEYFGESSKLDIFNTHRNTKDGIHVANMGGTYMGIVYGFGGLRIKEDGLYFAPSLPEQWTDYNFKIKYEDSQILVEVNKNKYRFTLIGGTQKSIFIYGKETKLIDFVEVDLK